MAGAIGAAGDKHANGWSIIATELDRSNKQCRERWINQVDPTINKGKWTEEEDAILKDALARLGERDRFLTFFLAGLRSHIWRCVRHTLGGDREAAAGPHGPALQEPIQLREAIGETLRQETSLGQRRGGGHPGLGDGRGRGGGRIAVGAAACGRAGGKAFAAGRCGLIVRPRPCYTGRRKKSERSRVRASRARAMCPAVMNTQLCFDDLTTEGEGNST